MVEVWKRWHLNGMNAACEHQRALGWMDKAKEEVFLYHWRLKSEVSKTQNHLKERVIRDATGLGKAELTEQERETLKLKYAMTTTTETLPTQLSELYEPATPLYNGHTGPKERKTLGWLSQNDHPEGILSRPCPVCGYKYGSAWLHEDLPAEIEAEVKSW